MNITITQKTTKKAQFNQLCMGQSFLYESGVYIKTSLSASDDNAFNLSQRRRARVKSDEYVVLVNASLTVTPIYNEMDIGQLRQMEDKT